MKNLYLLGLERPIEKKDMPRRALNFLCRCGLVLCGIAFIVIWGGAEDGAILFWRRFLWAAIDGILILGFLLGDAYTDDNYFEEDTNDE